MHVCAHHTMVKKMRISRRSHSTLILSLLILCTIHEVVNGFSAKQQRPQSNRWATSASSGNNNLVCEKNRNAAAVNKRKRQARMIPTDRRPRNYWLKPQNLRRGLCDFWRIDCGLSSSSTNENEKKPIHIDPERPTIPNEVLLFYFERHDLRAAIARNGGREEISQLLGGAPIMPGRWQEAVRNCPELRALIAQETNDLSLERPPRIVTSNAVRDRIENRSYKNNNNNNSNKPPRRTWSEDRKHKGYWTLQTLVRELFEYVDAYRLQHQRPAVWMPRPSELAAHGRDDLRQAVTRFGGVRKVARTAGMVPHREWYYFEGQLELLLELRAYLDAHCNGDYRTFPNVSVLRQRGYHQLHALIQYFGGRKFLAARLGMNVGSGDGGNDSYSANNSNSSVGMIKFGSFDLDFAIRLLQFVRQDHLKRSPPLPSPCLAMPSRSKLLASGGEEGAWLDAKIDEYGGYENVARRLGLALFPMH